MAYTAAYSTSLFQLPDFLRNGIQLRLRFLIPLRQAIVLLLIFLLVDCRPSVFGDHRLRHFREDAAFSGKPVPLRFKTCRAEKRFHGFAAVGDDLVLHGEHFLKGRSKRLSDILFGHVGGMAMRAAFVLAVAAPYDLAVLAVGMPYLGTVPRAAFPAAYSA